MRKFTIHKKDVKLDREKLDKVLDERCLTYMELYEKSLNSFGLDITYKGFMNLISNRSSWKLIYAIAILDVLNSDIFDLFSIVDIDIDKKISEKNEWVKKYQKGK